jgi:hypothetical protein
MQDNAGCEHPFHHIATDSGLEAQVTEAAVISAILIRTPRRAEIGIVFVPFLPPATWESI